jgi:hypothetical protein
MTYVGLCCTNFVLYRQCHYLPRWSGKRRPYWALTWVMTDQHLGVSRKTVPRLLKRNEELPYCVSKLLTHDLSQQLN